MIYRLFLDICSITVVLGPFVFWSAMFLLRRERVPNKASIPPYSASTSQQSKSFTSLDLASRSCSICRKANVPFAERSRWDDTISRLNICIECVEVSLSVTNNDSNDNHTSPSGDFRDSTRGKSHTDSRCTLCYRFLSASDFPDGYITRSCRHEPRVCLDCMEKSIIESLNSDLATCILCPYCTEPMSAVDVWRFSGHETFLR